MSRIEKKFIVKLQGKDFILYNGLVDVATKEGLLGIDVELLQTPSADNNMTAIARATAKTKDKTFTDIGDASPSSVSKMLVPHIIRMAATRAKARALRDLTNIGMTAVEEMIDESDTPRDPNQQAYQRDKEKSDKGNDDLKCSSCSVGINEAVKKYSTKNFGKALCRNCQQKHKK